MILYKTFKKRVKLLDVENRDLYVSFLNNSIYLYLLLNNNTYAGFKFLNENSGLSENIADISCKISGKLFLKLISTAESSDNKPYYISIGYKDKSVLFTFGSKNSEEIYSSSLPAEDVKSPVSSVPGCIVELNEILYFFSSAAAKENSFVSLYNKFFYQIKDGVFRGRIYQEQTIHTIKFPYNAGMRCSGMINGCDIKFVYKILQSSFSDNIILSVGKNLLLLENDDLYIAFHTSDICFADGLKIDFNELPMIEDSKICDFYKNPFVASSEKERVAIIGTVSINKKISKYIELLPVPFSLYQAKYTYMFVHKGNKDVNICLFAAKNDDVMCITKEKE